MLKLLLQFHYFSFMFVTLNGNNNRSYRELLDKSYVNENCGIINYPSEWNFDDKIQNDATLPMNYIVEFQPNKEEVPDRFLRV